MSTQKLPQAGVANQLAHASERMGDDIAGLVSAENDSVREQNFSSFEERFDSTAPLLGLLDDGVASEGQLVGLEEARIALLDAARRVNEAQANFLTYRAQQNGLRTQATTLRQDLQASLEGAIDDAEGADVETLLRLGLSANFIATLYADASAARTESQLTELEDRFSTYTDDVRINLAILQDAATPEVRDLSERFLAVGEGEEGLFAVRRLERGAYSEARSSRRLAVAAVTRQNEAITELVDDISAAAEIASQKTLKSVETNSIILSIIAVLSLGMATWLGYFYVHRSILKRLDRLGNTMGEVAEGQLEVEVPGLKVTDEIGKMARALEVFRENAVKAEKVHQDMIAAQEEKMEAERREREAAEQRRVAEAKAEKERREADEKAREEREAAAERERQLKEEAAQREMEERERQREREAEALRQRAEEEARLMREKAEAEEQARQEREAAAERRREEEERRRQEKLAAEERERQLKEEAAEKERIAEKKRQDAEAKALREKAEEEKRRL
ncbi:MAG: HAMP domain-containing protein, partial [Planctomycetota bacterium]